MSFRPSLEALEDRLLPSALPVPHGPLPLPPAGVVVGLVLPPHADVPVPSPAPALPALPSH